MFRSPITLLLVALLMVWAVGCSDNPLETSGDTPNLPEDFGGYTATSEPVAFGDSELLEAEGEEEIIDECRDVSF